jgi:hypothetical protein
MFSLKKYVLREGLELKSLPPIQRVNGNSPTKKMVRFRGIKQYVYNGGMRYDELKMCQNFLAIFRLI